LSSVLNQQVMIHLQRGKWAIARPRLEEILAHDREHLGEHPAIVMNLYNLSIVRLIENELSSAVVGLRESDDLFTRLLPDLIHVPAERQRMVYVQAATDQLQAVLSLHGGPSQESLLGHAYDLVITRKGLWVDALAMDRLGVYLRHRPELHERYQEWSMWSRQIALRLANGPGLEKRELHQQWLDQWQTHLQDIELELRPHTPEIGLERPRFSDDEQSEPLPMTGLIVEWVRIVRPHYPDIFHHERAAKFPVEYHTFIVEPQTRRMRAWLNLGSATVIDDAVRAWQLSGFAPAAGERLRQLIWAPVEPHIESTNAVWLIPDGELVCVPLHRWVGQATSRSCLSLAEAIKGFPRAKGPAVAVGNEQARLPWWRRLFQREPIDQGFGQLLPTQIRPMKINQLLRPSVVLFDLVMTGTGEEGSQVPTTTMPIRWDSPLENCGLRGDHGVMLTAKQLSGLDLVGSIVVLPKLGDATASGIIGIVRALFLSGAVAVFIQTRRVTTPDVRLLLEALMAGESLTKCLENEAPFLVYERGGST